MKNFLILSVLLVGFALSSCSEDPENTQISVEMKAVTINNSFDPYGRTEVSDVTFTAVLLGLRELELETESENESEIDGVEDDEDEIEFEGQFIIDLINGTSDPELGIAELEAGTYHEIELELAPYIESSYSVKIKGKYTPQGGTETEFIYTYALPLELELEKENGGFQLPEGGLSSLLILIDLDAIFDNISFDNAVVGQDNIVHINSSENASIATQIEGAFLAAFDVGEDNDDDGEIDDD